MKPVSSPARSFFYFMRVKRFLFLTVDGLDFGFHLRLHLDARPRLFILNLKFLVRELYLLVEF